VALLFNHLRSEASLTGGKFTTC